MKRNMIRTSVFGACLWLCCSSLSAQTNRLPSAEGKELKIPYAEMALTAELLGPVVDEPEWYVWCFSPLMTEDGKVHALVSRWPAAEGMEGWSEKNAEIAHYVADRPEGPFKYVRTILNSESFPDKKTMMAPHNPRLEYVDGKYICLFICQDPSFPVKCGNQRVCMMVADDINGPWRFAGENNGIMVSASKNPEHWTYQAAIGADNPAFLKIGKKYYIYYKCGTPKQLDAKYGYAVSDKLEGPYTLCDAPITDNVSYIEDAQAFRVGKQNYLLTTDNFGNNSGVFGNLILWKSKDGRSFSLKDAKIALGTLFDYWGTPEEEKRLKEDSRVFFRSHSGKLERPAVLKVHGVPQYLYGAGGANLRGGSVAETYVFKIKWNKGK